MMQVEVKIVSPIQVLSMRHTGPYASIGNTFGKLWQVISENGLPMNSMIGIYYDDPATVPAEELRSDACLMVAYDYSGPVAGLERTVVEGGRYAVTRFVGPYSGLPGAWNWLFSEGLSSAGVQTTPMPCYELYVHHDELHPENCITDIYVPVA